MVKNFVVLVGFFGMVTSCGGPFTQEEADQEVSLLKDTYPILSASVRRMSTTRLAEKLIERFRKWEARCFQEQIREEEAKAQGWPKRI